MSRDRPNRHRRSSPPSFRAILMVEDDDSDAVLLQNRLARFRPPVPLVSRAATLAEAKERLKANRFDVVIADLRLSDAGPQDVLFALSDLSGDATLVVVSGFVTPELLRLAMECRIEGVLAKDLIVEGDLLESQVLQAIARKTLLIEQREQFADLEARLEEQAQEMAEQARKIQELETIVARFEGKDEGRGEGIEMSRKALAGVIALTITLATAIAAAVFGN